MKTPHNAVVFTALLVAFIAVTVLLIAVTFDALLVGIEIEREWLFVVALGIVLSFAGLTLIALRAWYGLLGVMADARQEPSVRHYLAISTILCTLYATLLASAGYGPRDTGSWIAVGIVGIGVIVAGIWPTPEIPPRRTR